MSKKSDENISETRSGLKLEACAKGSKKHAKQKKNRIFVGGIPIDLLESKNFYSLKTSISNFKR